MNRLTALILFAGASIACGGGGEGGRADSTPPPVPTEFGVHGSRAIPLPRTVDHVRELGARWIRVNFHLEGQDSDVRPYLEAGVDLVLTLSNRDPDNARTTYGLPADWPGAGFPFASRERYERDIQEALRPLLPYVARGRRIWVQCENEAGDASVNPDSRYWRGTTDDYLRQLDAFHGVLKALDRTIPVVLTSFASRALDAAIDPSHPAHEYQVRRITRLMSEGRYDAVDLHFYGCAEDIPRKVAWVRERLPAGRPWITTECSGPDPACSTTPDSWRDDPEAFEREEARQVPLRLGLCEEAGAAIALWFSLYDLHGETSSYAHLGLIDRRILEDRREGIDRTKPAYDAFRTFVARHS